MAAGAALRIAGLWTPLTYDELSALCRLDYESVGDLMTHAVRLGDVHPGGVQLFLWLWCGLFGTAGWVVRLPFVAMGIASIWLIYVVGRRLFGEWPALLPTAYVALSQYTVYYSLMARPYAAGLFFMLCSLLCLTHIAKGTPDGGGQDKCRWMWLLLFALFEALCAYTHYFSLLSATLLAVAGFVMVVRSERLRYVGACVLAVALFAPHLPITFYQLFAKQGIGGWLSVPTPAFLPDYVRYLFHHSLVTAAVAVAGYWLCFSLEALRRNWRLVIWALSLWLVQLLVGYAYSVTVNPLLQFSSLIFVLPFLLLAVAGTVDSAPNGRHPIALLGFSVAMVASLFVARQHYEVMGREWIAAAAEETQDARERFGADRVTCLFDVAIDKLHYYDSTITSLPRSVLSSPRLLDSVLAACNTDLLLCAGIDNPRLLDVVSAHYPRLLRCRDCVSREVLLFAKLEAVGEYPVDRDALGAAADVATILHAPFSAPRTEYCDLLDTVLGDIADSRFCCLNTSITFALPDSCEPTLHLVTETYIGGRRVDWREAVAADYCRREGEVCTLNLPVRMDTFVKHRTQLGRTRVKVYVWNPEGDTVSRGLDCEVRLYASNRYRYGVLEEM